MKKILFFIAALLMQMTVMAETEAVKPSGDGILNPYEIASVGNLIWFANQVNNSDNFINGKLTADINLGDNQTMIGTKDCKYGGVFDGNGHTITVNYTATAEYTALFRYVRGAVIKNLATTGTITTDIHSCAAGIVAYNEVEGTSTKIQCCQSSVAITSSVEGDGCHGGIVAQNHGTVVLTNVLFDGKLLGPNTTSCGGLVGWSSTSTEITNCLFNPSEVTFNANQACTLSRGNRVTINNTYYTTALGTTQGTQTTTETLASGEVCYNLNNRVADGTQAWYQTLGTDAAPVPNNNHGTVYDGTNLCTTSSYCNEQYAHTPADANKDGEIFCSDCNKFISYQSAEKDGSGSYVIDNRGKLIWFANQVNLGGKESFDGKLTADIDLGDNQTMIGDEGVLYKGTFDGNGHTVTINYTAKGNVTALFRYVGQATIKNLKTTGSISSNYNCAAGIVGQSGTSVNYDTHTYITNCQSSVTITMEGNKYYLGGIMGYTCNSISLDNVLFDGKLLGNATECGGLIGKACLWVSIANSLFNPSELNVNTSSFSTFFNHIDHFNNLIIENSYYTTTFGEIQGTLATQSMLSSGVICYKLNKGVTNGSQVWYQTLQADATPILDSNHGTVYGGDNHCPINTFSNEEKSHISSETNTDGVIYCKNCRYACGCDEPTFDNDNNLYLIANKGNLVWFANSIKSGNTSINAKLTADISLDDDPTMIGTSDKKYAGTFDGNWHTITVDYTAIDNNTGLFRYVNDATIKNLSTTGTISTENQNAAGIVAYSEGTTNITNSQSSVAITSSLSGDGTHGGIVAKNQGTVKLTNDLFDGKLLGQNTTNCGGLVGWSKTSAEITNCLFNPSQVTFKADGAYTLSRGNGVTTNNTYYTTALGTIQGTQVTTETLASGEVCYKLNNGAINGTQAWYQALNTDGSPVLKSDHGTVYYGSDACPSTLTYSNQTHNIAASGSNGYYTGTCSSCNKTCYQYETPEYDAASNTYKLTNMGNLWWFANYANGVDGSAYATMQNDIDCNNVTNWPVIGNESATYCGTFDGNGHRIKNLIVANGDMVTGVFGRLGNGANIKNLIVDSSCSFTRTGDGSGAAAIADCVNSDEGSTCNITIENCGNEASVKGNKNTAGILGAVFGNTATVITINNCYNTGKISGSSESATICGWAGKNLTITNCYNSGAITGDDGSNYLFRYTDEGSHSISNCYDTNGGNNATLITPNHVRYGYLCSKLNASSTVFTQDLGTDAYPIPGNAGLLYDRATATGKYGTICLPLTFTVTGAKVYSAALNDAKDAVELTEVTTLDAGTPYIYQATADAQNFTLTGSDFTETPVAAPLLAGVFANTKLTANDYVLQTRNGGQQFYKVISGSEPTLSAFKAYISSEKANQVKAETISLGDNVDAIGALKALTNGDARIYDLSGRQLDKLQKGINIVNGVKILVK